MPSGEIHITQLFVEECPEKFLNTIFLQNTGIIFKSIFTSTIINLQ